MFKTAGFRTGTVLANPIVGSRYGLTRDYDFVAGEAYFGAPSPPATRVLKTAREWLDKDRTSPFFLSVLLFDPHHPYTPSEVLKREFCPDCDRRPIVHPRREYRGKLPTDKQVADMKNLYSGEVRGTDTAIRDFYGWLESSGLAERTTTVLVADHGEAFGEHQVFEHAFHIWDEVVRTPLVLSGAGVASRGFVDAPTQHVDVLPTLARLGGLPMPQMTDGVPLVHRGGEELATNRISVSEVSMYGIHRLSVRDRDLKVTYHNPLNEPLYRKYHDDLNRYPSVVRGREKWEFYNLRTDPMEKNDLSATINLATHPLAQAVRAYQAEGNPGALEEPVELDAQLIEDLKVLGYLE